MVVDTSIVIEHLRIKNKSESTLFQLSKKSELYISSISVYELHMGALTPDREVDIEFTTADILHLPFTDSVAKVAANIYRQLRSKNKMIEFRDIFIAATCIVNELPIVTLNKKHFERIDGLQIF